MWRKGAQRRQGRGRRSQPALFAVATVVMAICAMGMAFASWTDDLAVDGEVYTGNVELGIYDYASWDPGPNYLEPGGAESPLNPPVDGTADSNILLPGQSAVWQGLLPTGAGAVLESCIAGPWPWFIQVENQASTHSINLGPVLFSIDEVMAMPSLPFYGGVREEFKNVYASYATGTTLVFGNGGTLPVHVTGLQVTDVDDPFSVLQYARVEHWDAFLWEGDTVVETWGEVYMPGMMPGLEEFLEAWLSEGPIQLDPGRVLELGISIVFVEPANGDPFPTGANASIGFEPEGGLWCEEGD